MYKIDTTPNALFQLFPDKLSPDTVCEHCGSIMYMKILSRAYKENSPIFICPCCGHDSSFFCKCENCRSKKLFEVKRMIEIKEQQIAENNKKLRTYYEEKHSSVKPIISIEDICDHNKIYLSTLINFTLRKKGLINSNLNSSNSLIMPTKEDSVRVLQGLVKDNILLVDPTSCEEEFSNQDFSVFDYKRVNYKFNFESYLYNQLANYDYSISLNTAYQLWHQIALLETLNYLCKTLDDLKFCSDMTPRMTSIIENLLEDFSVSQIFTIIYSSTSRAARESQIKGLNKNHAKNIAVNSCKLYGEKAKENNWIINRYKNISFLDLSEISEFYLYEFLKIGDNGFNLKPSVELLDALPCIYVQRVPF